MKEIKHYVCDYCNTEYADEEKCLICEGSHEMIDKITKQIFNPISNDKSGYPIKIEVGAKNGKRLVYKRIN